MVYLIKLVSVAAAVLFWHLYHLDPNVAQVKDVLQLLHSQAVHGHIAVGFMLVLFMDERFCSSLTFVHAAPGTSRIRNFAVKEGK